MFGEIVWCKYGGYGWWPAICVPKPLIPDRVLTSEREPTQICVYFFGTYNYGWVSEDHLYRYVKGDAMWRGQREKKALKKAIDEAEQWINRYQEIGEKNAETSIKNHKLPSYKKIETNRVMVEFKQSEFNKCKCSPNDTKPCRRYKSSCSNANLYFECDPDLCPAKDKCENQYFHRGEQFSFQVKMTKCNGWGLFTNEKIREGKFIIEYVGEVVDSKEFEERFDRAKTNKDHNYHFFLVEKNMYIDSVCYHQLQLYFHLNGLHFLQFYLQFCFLCTERIRQRSTFHQPLV